MDYQSKSIELHKQFGGKLKVASKMPVTNKEELSLAYSPGVAGPSMAIAEDKARVRELTWRKNVVAVVSDGSAVLGLGNIGPEASLPVMEGKCVLLKEFADVDAVPIVLDTQDTEEIIKAVKLIAPSFSGINLEDISAPRCFEIEERLQKELDIPVFHDDQHGTAIVMLAGLINAGRVVGKDVKEMKVVINGAGAAAIAGAKLLSAYGFSNMIMCDSQGIISKNREGLNAAKQNILQISNRDNVDGKLEDAIKEADIFLGLSVAGALTQEMVKSMGSDPIIMAMANPTPEIMPEDAKNAGARIIATGRSDYPNQVNNVLGFPGIFRGLLDKNKTEVTTEMKINAAEAIASLIDEPNEDLIIPNPFDERVVEVVSGAI